MYNYEKTLWAVRHLSERAILRPPGVARAAAGGDARAPLPLTLRIREAARLDAERAKGRVGIGEKVIPAQVTLPWRDRPKRGFVLQRDNWGFWEKAVAKVHISESRA